MRDVSIPQGYVKAPEIQIAVVRLCRLNNQGKETPGTSTRAGNS